MVLASIALLCGIIEFFSGRRRPVYLLVLVATWIVGFFDALHHSRDAWAIMPTAVVLSVIVTVLACVATWIGFASRFGRDTSELQSLMRISYAVFCLKKKIQLSAHYT